MKYPVNFEPQRGDYIRVIKTRVTRDNWRTEHYQYVCYKLAENEIFAPIEYSGASYSTGNKTVSGEWSECCYKYQNKRWTRIKALK